MDRITNLHRGFECCENHRKRKISRGFIYLDSKWVSRLSKKARDYEASRKAE